MHIKHLSLLRSPITGDELSLSSEEMVGERVKSGLLSDGTNTWPIVDFIPRFVPKSDYWDSFSLQWERHPDIMHSLHSNMTAYKERFEKEAGWGKNLAGQTILEAGSGVGSFTSLALETGATIVSFDVSAGVESNYKYNGTNPNLLLVQASIYDMPFEKSFDKAFCFGVLQHTPDPKKSFLNLVEMLRPDGDIATDIYADVKLTRYHGMLRTKYFVRRFIKNLRPKTLYDIIKIYVKIMWPVCRMIQKIPKFGVIVSQHLLIDNYEPRLKGMKPDLYAEFAVVDIIDMLGASYDLPATKEEFLLWHKEAGLKNIDVDYGYNGLEGRGRKTHQNETNRVSGLAA